MVDKKVEKNGKITRNLPKITKKKKKEQKRNIENVPHSWPHL